MTDAQRARLAKSLSKNPAVLSWARMAISVEIEEMYIWKDTHIRRLPRYEWQYIKCGSVGLIPLLRVPELRPIIMKEILKCGI